jgi:hypothetical protein
MPESRGDSVSRTSPPFFALFVAFSIGANADGRELVLAGTLLVGAWWPSDSTIRPAAGMTSSSR